jgi:hypothetical protein
MELERIELRLEDEEGASELVRVTLSWDEERARLKLKEAHVYQRAWPCGRGCDGSVGELEIPPGSCAGGQEQALRLAVREPVADGCEADPWNGDKWCRGKLRDGILAAYWVEVRGRPGPLGPLLVGQHWVGVAGHDGLLVVEDAEAVQRHKEELEGLWEMRLENETSCTGGGAKIRAMGIGRWRVIRMHCRPPRIAEQIDEIRRDGTPTVDFATWLKQRN